MRGPMSSGAQRNQKIGLCFWVNPAKPSLNVKACV